MNAFNMRERRRAQHQQKINNAEHGLKLAKIFGAATVAGALWINVNMDDGEMFDLHKHIPAKVEQALQENPGFDREIVTAQGNDLASAWEKNMRLVTLVFPLFSGLNAALWFSYRQRLLQQQKEDPQLRPPPPRPPSA